MRGTRSCDKACYVARCVNCGAGWLGQCWCFASFASRYHTFALLFWCCLGLLLLMSELVTANKRTRFLVVQVCILTIIVWSSHITRNDVRGARIRGFRINVAATAMFVGARDDVQFAKAFISCTSLLCT